MTAPLVAAAEAVLEAWDHAEMLPAMRPRMKALRAALSAHAEERRKVEEEIRRELRNECERRDDIIASETHLRKHAEEERDELRHDLDEFMALVVDTEAELMSTEAAVAIGNNRLVVVRLRLAALLRAAERVVTYASRVNAAKWCSGCETYGCYDDSVGLEKALAAFDKLNGGGA